MVKGKLFISLFVFFIATCICNPAHAGVAPDISGTWQGSWNSHYGTSGGLTAVVTQSGSTLGGSLNVLGTTCGNFYNRPLSGSISGNVASFTATAHCSADGSDNSLQYTDGVVSGNSLSGDYAVNSDGEPWDYGTFNLTRSVNIIKASAGTGGTISPSGTISINAGSNQTFLIQPASGYKVLDVKVDGLSIGAKTSYTFSNISSNHTIAATFSLKPAAEGAIAPMLSLLLGDNNQTSSDSTPPSIPTNLSAVASSTSSIDLQWSTSTDNVGVAGYKVYSGSGVFIKSVGGTSTSMIGLSPDTLYCYMLSAYDAAGNESGKTSQKCARTQSDINTIRLKPQYDNAVLINSLNSNTANSVFQNSTLPVGCNWVYSSLTGIQDFVCGQGLVRFDLSALSGKTIISAGLTLTTSMRGVGYYPRQWHVRALATSWSPSSVTWNIVENTQYYTQSQIILYPPGYYGQSDIFDLDVTGIVQNWVNGTWNNYGLLFGCHDYTFPYYTSYDAFEFYSLEDPGQEWPELEITYR